jgi:hypothetical protein
MVGDLVDLDHALVVAFLRDRGLKAPAPPRAPTKRRNRSAEPGAPTGRLLEQF